ncbi:MAG: PEP-CTERM sorting domain-containing protein [Terriglobales bacterium]
MRNRLFLAVLATVALLGLPTLAMADLCHPDGNPNDASWCLINTNTGTPTAELQVHVTLSGNVLSVHAESSVFTNLRIDQFYMNNNNGNLLPGTSDPAGWVQVSNPPFQADGFGAFATMGKKGPHTVVGPSVQFTLSGTPTFNGGNAGAIFVAHVRYQFNGQDCSAFISNAPVPAGAPAPGTDTRCGSTTEVPEPGSLALLGTGIFAAVGALRRRFSLS